MNPPFFSVIVPMYNKETAIQTSIRSILSQTYKNFEVIVVDDGSTDHSVDTIKQFSDERLKFYSKSNGGPSSARNYGIKKAQGDWITFLDADDILYPDALFYFVKGIQKYPEAEMICGNFNIHFPDRMHKLNNNLYEGIVPTRKKMKWAFFYKYFCRMGNMAARREVAMEHLFNEKFYRYEDVEAFTEWFKYHPLCLIPQVLMEYRCAYSELRYPLKDCNRDYMFHMDFKSASFWQKCILARIYEEGKVAYPDKWELLKKKYGYWDFYRYFYMNAEKIVAMKGNIKQKVIDIIRH